MKKNYILFLLLLLTGSRLMGQERPSYCLSLDSCRTLAIRNNKELQMAGIRQRVAYYEHKVSFTKFLLRVSVAGTYMHTDKEISLLSDGQKDQLNNLGTALSTAVPALGPLAGSLNGIGSSLTDALRTDTRDMGTAAVLLMQPVYMGGKIMAYNRITRYASSDVHVYAHCSDMAEAEELLKRQEVYGIVHIPSTFCRDLWQGEQTHIGLYCDMCSMLYYKGLMLTATNVSLEMNKDIKVERHIHGTTEREDDINRMPIEYEQTALYNPQSGFAAFLIPPVLMLIIQQTLLLGIGMSAGDSREKHLGSIRPFHKAYKNPVHIVAGKAMLYFLLYMMIGSYMFAFVTPAFRLPQSGDYVTFIAFLVPYLLAFIFLAMVLSAFVYRREDCIMLFVFLSVPMLFLSGISWPGASMPPFWKYVSWLFPSTFGMNGYVRIMGSGASLSDIAPEYSGLWIQTTAYFLLACLLYRIEIRWLLNKRKTSGKAPAAAL